MKKFECRGCENHCVITTNNAYCPVLCHLVCEDWHEVKEETTTESNQLPKLTAEVFDHPNCPEWAKYAAVDVSGIAHYFDERPYLADTFFYNNCAHHWTVDGDFDASDWQNSLIERPAKIELPDWCKVGEWVYDNVIEEYAIVKKEDNQQWYVDNQKTLSPARKRPFNAKEMKALVGKVLGWDGNLELVISYDADTAEVYVDHMWCSAKCLMDNGYTIDGKPCYVLEHKNERGGWVE